MIKSSRTSALMFALTLSACAPGYREVAHQITDDLDRTAACEDFSSKITATLVQAALDEKELPPVSAMREHLSEKFDNQALVDRATELYEMLTERTRNELGATDRDLFIEAVMALEIGDETTPEKRSLKHSLRAKYSEVRSTAQAAGLKCVPPAEPEPEVEPTPEPTPDVTQTPDPVTKLNPAADGAIRVLTTAYQSCQAKRLPAMTSSTASVQGIVITGTHSNGVGQKREIGNLKQVQQTHYYVREGIEKDPSCFNVYASPLIYDYGGKPYASTAVDSSLDMFRNAGSGTKVLGIDCSGYVFSALAASGLRVSPSKRLTASLVYGINARMYMEPAANGLSCLIPVPSAKDGTLRDGDILASTGHVLMVASVGSDPFGVQRLRSISDCVTANMSYRNFDFDVLQSSPVKNGIGIDRIRASDYFTGQTAVRDSLYRYAVAACKARFGQTSTVKPAGARLVRHKLTPECMDRPVTLARESCVRSCPN